MNRLRGLEKRKETGHSSIPPPTGLPPHPQAIIAQFVMKKQTKGTQYCHVATCYKLVHG